MKRLLAGAKLPKMEVQKEEGRKLLAKKKRLYGEYQKARRDMQEVLTIKANIDCLLGYSEPGKRKKWSVEDMKNKEQSDAITSGHVGPKLTGSGRAPTSSVCGLWPQRHCLPLSDTLKSIQIVAILYLQFHCLNFV